MMAFMTRGLALRGPKEAAILAGLVMLAAGVPVHAPEVSLDPGSPSWATPADLPNPGPILHVEAASLGVSSRDCDALRSIFEDLDPAAIWRAYFSLAPGSPLLAAGNASPTDSFYKEFDSTSRPAWSATSSGLLDTDNVDALETTTVPEPQAVLLLAGGAVLLAIKRTKAN